MNDATRSNDYPNSPTSRSEDCKIDTNDVYSLLIFDSISTEFSLFIFIHQLLVHLLQPWLVFTVNPYTQSFIPRPSFANLWFTVVTPLLFFGMMISYSLSPDDIIFGAWIWPLLYYLLHKVVIATKYACLSKTEYHRFQTASKRHGPRYRKQMELLSSWVKFDPMVRDFEVGAAMARIGLRPAYSILIRLNHLVSNTSYASQSENMKHWYEYLMIGAKDCHSKESNQEYVATKTSETSSHVGRNVEEANLIRNECGVFVSVRDICSAIIMKADSQHQNTVEHFNIPTLLLSGTIPLVVIFYGLSWYCSLTEDEPLSDDSRLLCFSFQHVDTILATRFKQLEWSLDNDKFCKCILLRVHGVHRVSILLGKSVNGDHVIHFLHN